MIPHKSRRILEAGQNVLPLQGRIFIQYLLDGIACSQKFQNRLHGDASSANHGTAIANIGINNDSVFHFRQ
jgi:hypothetical protein